MTTTERFRRVTEVDRNPQRTVIIFKDETDTYVAHVPSMPGCVTQATSKENILQKVQVAMQAWSEAAVKKGYKPLNNSRLLVWREAARVFYQVIDLNL